MPAEIGPHPSGIRSAVTSEFHGAGITPQRNSPDQSGIPPQYDSPYLQGRPQYHFPKLRGKQGKQNGKDEGDLYRGRYVEPESISAREPDRIHKVVYCVATLD